MIRGERKFISKGTNKIDVDVNIHNRFDIKVFDAKTRELKQEARGFNVICKGLWGALLRDYSVNPYNSQGEYFDEIRFGQGSGTPSENDTNLFSQIDKRDCKSNISKENYDAPSGVYYITKYIKLESLECVGKTITEVGIGVNSNASNLTSTLCTHAMLEDMNGNPISITKTDTDVIYIYATVYVHMNPYGLYDKGSIQFLRYDTNNFYRFLAGSLSNCYLALMNVCVNRYGTKGTGTQSGSTYTYYLTADCTNGNLDFTRTYDLENKKMKYKMSRMNSTVGNIGGIHMFMFTYYSTSRNSHGPSMFMLVGGDWYPYTEIKNEAVGTGDGTSVDFALDFQRARDVQVFIDGVETIDFTVDYAPATTDNQHYYFEQLETFSTPENHVYRYIHETNTFAGTRVLYNPFYEMGVKQMYKYRDTAIYVSNDLSDWVEIGPAATSTNYSFAIPEEYQHYKYWKCISTSSSGGYFPYGVVWANDYDGKALHLNNPPADGAVITANYKTDTIAKDADHVFDMEIEFSFGEYLEA